MAYGKLIKLLVRDKFNDGSHVLKDGDDQVTSKSKMMVFFVEIVEVSRVGVNGVNLFLIGMFKRKNQKSH